MLCIKYLYWQLDIAEGKYLDCRTQWDILNFDAIKTILILFYLLLFCIINVTEKYIIIPYFP